MAAEVIQIAIGDVPSIPDLMGVAGVGSLWGPAKMAQTARTHLVTLAQKQLFTSARDYVKSIQPMRIERVGGRTRFIIEVTGSIANMVERGAEPWDLRLTILKPGTRRLRVSKQGYLYVSVPFFHMGPTAGGRNGAPMGGAFTKDTLQQESRAFRGQMTAVQARVLGKAVHRDFKKLSATLSKPSPDGGRHAVSYGGKLAEGLAPILRPRHATDIYAGMVREEKTYAKKTESQGVTFRIISNNPASMREDAGGKNWMHPGIKARHLVPQAQAYIHQLFDQGAFNV